MPGNKKKNHPKNPKKVLSQDKDELSTDSEYGDITEKLLALEAKFQQNPSRKYAEKLVDIYSEIHDIANIRRIRKTLLETIDLTPGT